MAWLLLPDDVSGRAAVAKYFGGPVLLLLGGFGIVLIARLASIPDDAWTVVVTALDLPERVS